jgi:hypothetical protein
MTQKLKCPACGTEVTLEQLIQTADLERLGQAQAAFGENWDLVREYLDCFRPPSGKPLQVKKLLRLAREVWEMWRPGRFEYGRQEYGVGREEFREALRATCNQVERGLTNHNYLKKVLLAAAEKTSQRLERELREREESLRGAGCKPVPPEEGLPTAPAWWARLTELGRAVRLAKTPEEKAEASKNYREHLEGGRHGAATGGEQH